MSNAPGHADPAKANVPGQNDPLTFPPIPLATGQVFRDADGTEHVIETLQVVATAADGTVHTVTFERRNGGQWWPPVVQ